MNRSFQPTSKPIRFALAVAAALASLLITVAIEGLVGHYQSQSAVPATAAVSVTVALT